MSQIRPVLGSSNAKKTRTPVGLAVDCFLVLHKHWIWKVSKKVIEDKIECSGNSFVHCVLLMYKKAPSEDEATFEPDLISVGYRVPTTFEAITYFAFIICRESWIVNCQFPAYLRDFRQNKTENSGHAYS